jgi:hypothetical protein
MKTTQSAATTPVEDLLLHVDQPPFDALVRIAIGFATLPVLERVTQWSGLESSGWVFVPLFLGVLFMLRLVPALVRKLLPFSPSIKSVWAERRQLAVRYDSYQWQKLFWIGIGLVGYAGVSDRLWSARGGLAAACLVSGALGLASWRGKKSQIDSAKAPAARQPVSV